MSKQKTAQHLAEIEVDENDSYDNSYSYDSDLVNDIVVSMNDQLNASDKKDDKKSEKEDEKDEEREAKNEDEKDEEDEEIVVLEFDNEKPFSFMMPSIPGALDDSEIVIPEISVEEDDEEEAPKEIDPWNWQHGGHSKFIPWAQGIVNMTPQHSGHDISGLERAIAWIMRLIKEFPKALSTDFKGEIDVGSSEELRDSLHAAVGQMNDRMERILSIKGRGKKASADKGMVKEAQKSTRISGVTITVPLLISGVARTLVNGTVSAGHSMEDMYDELKKKYAFTDREEFEIQILLSDMGYPIYQDRGRIGEQVDKSRSDNFDWAANYKS